MMIEKFSKEEQEALKQRLESYGAKGYCAQLTGIHRTTITRVLKTGEATTPIVQKLRLYINNASTRVFIEEAA